MKVTWAVILSLSYFAATFALPATREGSEEIDFVPLEEQNGGPIIDTGVIEGPWVSPFDGLFESFAGIMARMRQQMDFLLSRLPFRNGTAENGSFPGFPEVDLSKGNTTSVTKIIDGHKVVINETEYKHEGDNGGAFFKVRVIDVLPDSSELTTEKNAESITTSPKEPESVENSYENEIPKNKEIEDFSSLETFDQPDSLQKNTVGNQEHGVESMEDSEEGPVRAALPLHPRFQKLAAEGPNWGTLESFEDNSIESAYRPYDLSRDTYINQIMADAGAPTNPDAEVFTNVEYSVPLSTKRFEKFMNPR